MSENLGVYAKREETKVSSPNVAEVGIPFFVGAAPAHLAGEPAAAGTPVLCTSWDEAVAKLGYSEDWESYPLCEAMYSHFQLYGCQPAIFLNVLDPSADGLSEAVEETALAVTDHRAVLAAETLPDGLTVKSGESELAAGTDYLAYYADAGLTVELLADGGYYELETLSVTGRKVCPGAVAAEDIAQGVDKVDLCMTSVGVVPDLIGAPGWSGDAVVAAVMAAKAENVSGLFDAFALIDVPCGADGVTSYDQLSAYKSEHSLTDPRMVLCWPMATLGGLRFHLATHLAGLIAQVDAGNGGIPYESPSNKKLQIDGLCLEDGTPVELSWPQVDLIAGDWGIVTAVNFVDQGWVAKGNYTACYPASTDVAECYLPVSRMMDFIGNTGVKTLWPKLDKPMTTPMVQSIATSMNDWLDALWSGGYLNGARVELLADENALANLLKGVLTFHVYSAPPVPMQKINFLLEYDVSYASTAVSI